MNFFDDYRKFYGTSLAGDVTVWNNRRYDVLIRPHESYIRGKRIWDFGSHDGRWAFAALAAGAEHVTCIEPGVELQRLTKENFDHYGVDGTKYDLVEQDGATFLSRGTLPRVDTVFLFGMLTLIADQAGFFGRLRAAGASTLIIDNHILRWDWRPVSRLFQTEVRDGNAHISDSTSYNGKMLGSTGSLKHINFMLGHFGWRSVKLDWRPHWGHPDMEEYRSGRRVSILATS